MWLDSNGNGIYDEGELGLAGVTVNLYSATGELVATIVSDANGRYLFENMLPGSYYLEFLLPSGYQFSPPDAGPDDSNDSDADQVTGRTPLFELAPGDIDLTWYAGIYLKPTAIDDEDEPDAPNRIFLPLIRNGPAAISSNDVEGTHIAAGNANEPTGSSQTEEVDGEERQFLPLVRRTGLGTKTPRAQRPRPPPSIRIRPQPPPYSCQQQLCLHR